jgi:hypothetical protein
MTSLPAQKLGDFATHCSFRNLDFTLQLEQPHVLVFSEHPGQIWKLHPLPALNSFSSFCALLQLYTSVTCRTWVHLLERLREALGMAGEGQSLYRCHTSPAAFDTMTDGDSGLGISTPEDLVASDDSNVEQPTPDRRTGEKFVTSEQRSEESKDGRPDSNELATGGEPLAGYEPCFSHRRTPTGSHQSSITTSDGLPPANSHATRAARSSSTSTSPADIAVVRPHPSLVRSRSHNDLTPNARITFDTRQPLRVVCDTWAALWKSTIKVAALTQHAGPLPPLRVFVETTRGFNWLVLEARTYLRLTDCNYVSTTIPGDGFSREGRAMNVPSLVVPKGEFSRDDREELSRLIEAATKVVGMVHPRMSGLLKQLNTWWLYGEAPDPTYWDAIRSLGQLRTDLITSLPAETTSMDALTKEMTALLSRNGIRPEHDPGLSMSSAVKPEQRRLRREGKLDFMELPLWAPRLRVRPKIRKAYYRVKLCSREMREAVVGFSDDASLPPWENLRYQILKRRFDAPGLERDPARAQVSFRRLHDRLAASKSVKSGTFLLSHKVKSYCLGYEQDVKQRGIADDEEEMLEDSETARRPNQGDDEVNVDAGGSVELVDCKTPVVKGATEDVSMQSDATSSAVMALRTGHSSGQSPPVVGNQLHSGGQHVGEPECDQLGEAREIRTTWWKTELSATQEQQLPNPTETE